MTPLQHARQAGLEHVSVVLLQDELPHHLPLHRPLHLLEVDEGRVARLTFAATPVKVHKLHFISCNLRSTAIALTAGPWCRLGGLGGLAGLAASLLSSDTPHAGRPTAAGSARVAPITSAGGLGSDVNVAGSQIPMHRMATQALLQAPQCSSTRSGQSGEVMGSGSVQPLPAIIGVQVLHLHQHEPPWVRVDVMQKLGCQPLGVKLLVQVNCILVALH
mmetsp:Transcript_2150/g.4825  ORF Transcript_2150/g.4825 Transcript_2150/m.4825 type:complete len:218 (-) Transcript_2150:877-1530(-)